MACLRVQKALMQMRAETEQEAEVIWRKLRQIPLSLAVGDQDPRLTQCSMAPRSVQPKQHLDLFSHFCTAKPS